MDRTPPSPLPYDGSADDAPVSKLWYGVIAEGLRKGRQQIHVAPANTGGAFVIRSASEGMWEELMRPPIQMYDPFLRRLKVMANLDLVKRVPVEEGRFRLGYTDFTVDIKATVRLRDDGQQEAMLDLPELPPNKRLKLSARVD